MFRKATLDDCPAVYRLICDMENKQLPYDRFSAIFEKQAESGQYYCLVCEKDGVIGVMNLRFEEQLHHAERVAEIMECAVDARYRSQGIGREMFAQACEIARERHCIQIEVDCNQLRVDAHRFYLREGMRNYHFKFSKALWGEDTAPNALGR